MRIALMIHALYGGGAERLMADLAHRWSDAHDVHLVTWSRTETDTYPVPSSVTRHGLDLLRVSPNPVAALWSNWKRVRQLKRRFKELQPDVILSFSDRTNITTLQATRGLNIPTWISEHSDPAKQQLGFVWEAWRKATYPHCTGCTVLTSHIAETMKQWVSSSKIHVIPPAIQPAAKTSTTVQIAGTHASEAKHTIIFVGRLSAEKRVDVLLDAWRRVASKLPQWQLLLIGDGDLRADLEARAAQIPRTQFEGWVEDPQPLLRQADIFALSSNYEGFPVALLEAMDLGLACMSTQCTKSIDMLNQDRPCVLTVPVGDSAEYALQLEKLCSNLKLREELGDAAQTRARDFYWTKIGPLWDAILDSARSA